MATLNINPNESYSIDVTVRESDKYTEQVYVRIDRHYIPEEVRGCNEMFLTPNQVEQLGMFLVRQAAEIRENQKYRKNVA